MTTLVPTIRPTERNIMRIGSHEFTPLFRSTWEDQPGILTYQDIVNAEQRLSK